MPGISISIIVPLYNEEVAIDRLQEQLRPFAGDCEVIFVDGGSTDGTCSHIDPAFRLLHAPKGRARQMNIGAQAALGDVLFFLHCDSILPPHPLDEIRRVMARRRVGCFGISFDRVCPVLVACRIASNFRCQFRRIIFGDQGLFINRELFFEVGMFPDLPLMEDYQLSLTLRSRGERIGMTRHRIVTSARRFPPTAVGQIRTLWSMVQLRRLYREGTSPADLARKYADVR